MGDLGERDGPSPVERVARLLGVTIPADIHERALDLGLSLPPGARRRRRAELIRRAGLLFVHVPKNAGMSINDALYGEKMCHSSIRYYRSAANRAIGRLPSFAIVRHPVDRFLSAFAYARRGGEANNRIARPFRRLYMAFRTIDDALDHIESARSLYHIDYIFRPQSWFVTDHANRVAVDTLIPFGEMDRLADIIPQLAQAPIRHLNAAKTTKPALTPAQLHRVRTIYGQDFALYDQAARA